MEEKRVLHPYLVERLRSLHPDFVDNPPTYKVPDDSPTGFHEQSLFFADGDGNILIRYFNLEGNEEFYENARWKKQTPYQVKRYHPDVHQELLAKNPKKGKYQAPAATPARLYLPPKLIDRFKAGETISTLFVTEGQFKAFAGSYNGLPIIGAFGISGWKVKKKLRMKDDLARIIKECKVQRLVLLMDSDLFKAKYVDEDTEMTERLWTFYQAARSFRETCVSINIDAYLMYIDPDLGPKGLDDLYEAFRGKEIEITDEAMKLEATSNYFRCNNISERGAAWLKGYFLLSSVDRFYLHNSEIIEDQKFTWNNGKFLYNEETQTCDILIHPEAKKFVRIGCDYFKRIVVVNSQEEKNEVLQPWNKGEITQDYVKDQGMSHFFKWVARYDAFTNLPDHSDNFKAEIVTDDGTRLYNTYHPLKWKPEEGDITMSMEFVKHVFGTQKLPNGKERWVAGLDYLSILYTYPAQKLPVIVLVNKLGGTGKSTFMFWLKAIYGHNASICSNEDFTDRFNADYANMLLALLDEGFIDKRLTYEKVKSMTTSPTTKLHDKGKSKHEIELFIKFILTSNDELNCIPITATEKRFWVIKVPQFEGKENPNLLYQLRAEIPAFLHHLKTREIVHPRKTRLWFEPKTTDTPALRRLVAGSKTWIEKEITEIVRGKIIDCRVEEIHMTVKELMEELPSKYEQHSVKNCLQEKMGLKEANSWMTKYSIDQVSGQVDEQRIKRSTRHYKFQAKDILTEEEYNDYFKQLQPA